jgi:IS30 family transposase
MAQGRQRARSARLGVEAIYAFIYRAARKGEFLWRYLTRRHKRRRPRRARPSRDTIKDRASIHDRPKDIEARADIGHWEGDLIICKRTRPMLVLHERKSRVMLAARLAGKTAAETISVMLAVFGRINPALRKSITFDNDAAFAQHTLLRTMRYGDLVLRRLRLLAERRCRKRQWSITTLAAASHRHRSTVRRGNPGHRHNANLTPRKCLGFKTPFQGILKELGKDVQIRFS